MPFVVKTKYHVFNYCYRFGAVCGVTGLPWIPAYICHTLHGLTHAHPLDAIHLSSYRGHLLL